MRWGIVALFIWSCGSASADAPSPIYDLSATRYLTYVELSRLSTIEFEEASAEYKISLEREKLVDKIWAMHQKLVDKKAITQEEFLGTVRNRDVARAQTRLWKSRMVWNTSLGDFNKEEADIAAGKPVNLDTLYGQIKGVWDAQCDVFQSEREVEEARVLYAKWRVDVVRRLHPTGSATLQELWQREFELAEAQEHSKAAHSLFNHCRDNIPTLEMVKKIQENDKAIRTASKPSAHPSGAAGQ